MKVPESVKNLYLDLRDKRLLPVVALLLVALVAIPFLVGGEADPIVPEVPVGSAEAADAASVEELTPFVTNEVPGIREFDKRLDTFRKSNPFKQQLTNPTKSQQDAVTQAEKAAEQLSEAVSGGSAGGASAAGGSADGGTTTTEAGSGTDATDTDGGSTGGEKVYLYSLEIDVKIGRVGDSKKVKGVKTLEYLPGKKRPVVQYVQGAVDQSSASFVVSRSVSSSEGEGECNPNPFNCQFLLLEVGQEQRFEYEPDGKTYRLKLIDVKLKKELVDGDDLSAAKRSKSPGGFERMVESVRG